MRVGVYPAKRRFLARQCVASVSFCNHCSKVVKELALAKKRVDLFICTKYHGSIETDRAKGTENLGPKVLFWLPESQYF